MNNHEGRQKILIVDDMPINIQVLNESLQENYQIFFATNGIDAINVARREAPDLILLDVMMPGMDGYETCKILKSKSFLAEIPVVFVTAMSDVENELIGLGLGAVDYIFKPIIPELVQRRVKIHLELKAQRDYLAKFSLQDELTELPNRRALESCLEREWQQAKRQSSHLSIILIDLDHFKDYNAACGHLAGDEALKKIARIISEILFRPLDFVARFNGTEFACVLPGTNLSKAEKVAESITTAVEAAGLKHPSSPTAPVITLCTGVATTEPDHPSDTKTLFANAYTQLCLSKR
ncbi:MAG TPA: diguanylate cyclase [Geopsychrobacteraceae bacterium]|nr:diguanylate cyclase [Geopsychrobacteraceae bacterium]